MKTVKKRFLPVAVTKVPERTDFHD